MQAAVDPDHESSAARKGIARICIGSCAILWMMLLVWSFIKAPIPGINEPHYFCKAKHFWEPDWCSGDAFLDSSNPHAVFYAAFGWLSGFLTLWQTAFVVRVVGLGILAIGWQRFSSALWKPASAQWFSLSVLLLLQAVVNFSGEWLVAGVESKVISYGFGFWAVGCLLRGKRLASSGLMGLAVSFHPLVGCWLTLCCMGAAIWTRLLPTERGEMKRMISQCITCGLVWLLCALPGLIPAISMLTIPVDDQTRFQADYLQVYYRLGHHLDPMRFALWRYSVYIGMLAAIIVGYWWGLRRKSRPQEVAQVSRQRFFFWVVMASFVIAAVGVLLGARSVPPTEMWGLEWRVKLLKFYPFRLFDLLAPIGVCLLLLPQIFRTFSASRLTVLTVVVYLGALCVPFPDRDPSRMSAEMKQDWIEMCEWIRTHTAEDAMVMTPRSGWAFKWFAHRAEYVTYKDCPQDAPNVVEWNRRLRYLKQWKQTSYKDEFFADSELDTLHEETGITHLLAWRLWQLDREPVFRNKHFRLYEVKE